MTVPMPPDSNQATAAAQPAAISAQLRGMACIVAGVAIFSVQDLVIKLLSGDYPLHQAMTIRSLTATPLLLLLVLYEVGWNGVIARRPGALLLRGVVMFCAYTGYYLGLAAMPIATCIALFFTAPLFITILSIPLLGERAGPRRWAAVLFGFTGMLVMLRPDSDVFIWTSLLPVFAALCYGLSQIMARRLGTFDRASVMALYGNGVFLIGGLLLSAVFGSGAFADEDNRGL
ncbi:MAG: DMT family transporter, partial [Parvibaculaceae bacterium]